MLCDSKCEDFALKLVAVCRKCLLLSHSLAESCSQQQKQFWQDLHIALLYRFKENEEIVAQLKLLSLEEGYQLVQRFADRGTPLPQHNSQQLQQPSQASNTATTPSR